MTVAELIEELREFPGYMEVHVLEQLDYDYVDYVEAQLVKTWELSDDKTVVVIE